MNLTWASVHVQIGSHEDLYSPILPPCGSTFGLERSWEDLSLSLLSSLSHRGFWEQISSPQQLERTSWLTPDHLSESFEILTALQQVLVTGRWTSPQPVTKPTHLLHQVPKHLLFGISLFSDGCTSEGTEALKTTIPWPHCLRHVLLHPAVISWPQLRGDQPSGAAASYRTARKKRIGGSKQNKAKEKRMGCSKP